MEENENTKLHWIRVRHKDSNEAFVDPMADIKIVVQQAFKEAPHLLSVKDPDKAERLRQILKVFVTKLEEDPTPVDEILKEFQKVLIREMGEDSVDIIFSFSLYVLYTFALHMRRDGAADKDAKASFNSAAALLYLYNTIPGIKPLVKGDGKLAEEDNKIYEFKGSPVVNAVCFEQDIETLKDIKDIVATSMGATGGQSWDEVAAACDKFVTEGTGTDEQKLAASLAYPTYDKPYFEVEGEK